MTAMRHHFKKLGSAALVVSLFCAPTSDTSRADPTPAEVPRIEAALAAWIASLPHAPPNSVPDFATPTQRALLFRTFTRALAETDWRKSHQLASMLHYSLIAIQDGTAGFWAAHDPSGRDPALVINLFPQRDVIFEAPHVPFELGTAEEAMVLLKSVGGRAAIISGAHRCGSRAFVGCSGRTAVCGRSEAYRDSDVGHNPTTLFHEAHQFFADLWPRSVAVSLHGMKEDVEGVKTAGVISTGARGADPQALLPATRLRVFLDRLPLEPGTIVSCNLPEDAEHEFRKLCGFTNVQGRYSNLSADICSASTDVATGRFIHLEQDWSILQPFAHDWTNIDRFSFAVNLSKGLIAATPPISN